MWLLRPQRAWRQSLCRGLTPLGYLAAAASTQKRAKAWQWVSGSFDRGSLQLVHPFHVLHGHKYGPPERHLRASSHQETTPSLQQCNRPPFQ